MTLVIAAYRHDLRGLAWREKLHIREVQRLAGGFRPGKDVALKLANGLPFENAVRNSFCKGGLRPPAALIERPSSGIADILSHFHNGGFRLCQSVDVW